MYLYNRAPQAKAKLVLAHGAGAPMDSAFMDSFVAALVPSGISVVRFEFPYMAERRTLGKKRPPNKASELLESWSRVICEQSKDDLPLFIGGKSMGGRMATVWASAGDTASAEGVICLGYPFHPVGKPTVTRTQHLAQFPLRCLIIQGERDKLGSRLEVDHYDLANTISVRWLLSADHDFRPLRSSGQSQQQCIETAALWTSEFILSSI